MGGGGVIVKSLLCKENKISKIFIHMFVKTHAGLHSSSASYVLSFFIFFPRKHYITIYNQLHPECLSQLDLDTCFNENDTSQKLQENLGSV